MRSFFENRRIVLLLAVLALGAVTVLAIGLDNIPFRDAQHFIREETRQTEPPLQQNQVPTMLEIPLWKVILFWILTAILVVLFILLLPAKWRKRLLQIAFRVAMSMLALWLVFHFYGDAIRDIIRAFFQVVFGLRGLAEQEAARNAEDAVPMPVFEAPQVSSTFSYMISFVFALLFLIIIWTLYRGWQKYRQLNTPKPLDEIARIARSSLDDLTSGRNSSDVIVNCYFRMNDVVAERRRLRRETAMTPREFALRLEQAGLPGEAVAGLTRLFEAVRYGDRRSEPKDVREAVTCLEKILHYCGESV
jgi:Domain of unknown function (DUF4129)